VYRSVKDIFIEAKQVLADADDICCFRVDATSDGPMDINCDTVKLQGNDNTFLEWNTPNILDVGAVEVTSVISRGTGAKSIHLLSTNVGSVTCNSQILVGEVLCEGGGSNNTAASIAACGVFLGIWNDVPTKELSGTALE